MSVEVISMLGVGVTILLAIGGTCGWMIHRTDSIGDRNEINLGARIDRVQSELVTRIDRGEVQLVEVKIAVARIEGPPRHLLTAR